jgi:hypothetical protein
MPNYARMHRAVLGIHRTQAGRRGIRLGRGQRAECPLLYNCAVERRPHLRHRTRPLCGRAVPPVELDSLSARAETHRHRSRPPQRARARCTSVIVTGPPPRPGAVPRPRRLNAGWGTRRHHLPRPPQRAGGGAARAVARAGPRGPPNCAARCGLPGCHSGRHGAGSPDCIATAGPGAGRPDVGGGGSAGAGPPGEIAEGAVHCEYSCPSNLCSNPCFNLNALSAANSPAIDPTRRLFGAESVRVTHFWTLFQSILRGIYFVSITFVIQPLHRFAGIISSKFPATDPTRRLLGAESVRATDFSGDISKYSSWTILFANHILCSSLASICGHRQRQIASYRSIPG